MIYTLFLFLLLACLTAVMWGGVDVWIKYNWGDEYMFSPVIHKLAKEQPIVAALLGLVFGGLLGHLFWSR